MEKNPSRSSEVLKQLLAAEETGRELSLVEAALYAAGRPLELKEICSVLKTRSKKRAQRLARILKKEYTSKNKALEILELSDERYVLQLKPEFTPSVKRLVKKPLLSTGPLKTLAYIAYKQPVSQKRVVQVRGHHAYGHIKLLRDMDLVVGEKKGRSTSLKTTKYFADYFGLRSELSTLKRQLRSTR